MAAQSKPTLFLGSSSEGIKLARAIETRLVHSADVDVWTNGLFPLGSGTLETLVGAPDKYDFAVFVLTPDDNTDSRGQAFGSPRDNVVFELGLFMSRLGRTRTFIVADQRATLKMPSDLAGITITKVQDRPDNLQAAVSTAASSIIDAIEREGKLRYKRPPSLPIPSNRPNVITVSGKEVRIAEFATDMGAIENYVFERCLVLGPAVIAPVGDVEFELCHIQGPGDRNLMFLELDDGWMRYGFLGLQNVIFRDCTLRYITIAGLHDLITQTKRTFGLAK